MDNFTMSKIEMIKFIRLFTELGLVDAKNVSEAWLNAFGINYITEPSEILQFARFVSLFAKGALVVNGSEIVPAAPKAISSEDIVRLSK